MYHNHEDSSWQSEKYLRDVSIFRSFKKIFFWCIRMETRDISLEHCCSLCEIFWKTHFLLQAFIIYNSSLQGIKQKLTKTKRHCSGRSMSQMRDSSNIFTPHPPVTLLWFYSDTAVMKPLNSQTIECKRGLFLSGEAVSLVLRCQWKKGGGAGSTVCVFVLGLCRYEGSPSIDFEIISISLTLQFGKNEVFQYKPSNIHPKDGIPSVLCCTRQLLKKVTSLAYNFWYYPNINLRWPYSAPKLILPSWTEQKGCVSYGWVNILEFTKCWWLHSSSTIRKPLFYSLAK